MHIFILLWRARTPNYCSAELARGNFKIKWSRIYMHEAEFMCVCMHEAESNDLNASSIMVCQELFALFCISRSYQELLRATLGYNYHLAKQLQGFTIIEISIIVKPCVDVDLIFQPRRRRQSNAWGEWQQCIWSFTKMTSSFDLYHSRRDLLFV